MRAACGESLLTAGGETWKRHRALVQPYLGRGHLEQFAPVIVEATLAMLRRWREHAAAGRPLEIVSEMMELILGIAAQIFFSADVHRDAKTVERSLAAVLDETWRRVENPFDPASIHPFLQRRSLRRAVAALDGVVYRILARRREKSSRDDLLASFMRARDESGRGWSDQELRDATLTLLLAGHETTANALAWAFYLVSQHPAVEAQMREELAEVLQGRSPRGDDLDRMPRTRNVFLETIRLYPSIWIIERRAVHDDEIGGYRIPARSMVLISPYVLHRRPDFWKDPEQFQPDRFAGEEVDEVAAGAYLPFGAGPRYCVGREMALLVAPLLLATVLASFRLRLVPGHPVACKPGITLRHAHGLQMLLEESPAFVPASAGHA
jgi:cytochrome P450